VQPSESLDYDAEKDFSQTEVVTVFSYMQFQKETVIALFELLETVRIESALEFGKETVLEVFEFFETVNPYAYLNMVSEGIEVAVDVSTFGTLGFVIAIIALAIAVTAFAMMKGYRLA